MTPTKKRVVEAWAGITNNKLDHGWLEEEGYQDGTYGIYTTRKEALKHYESVVPCTITYSLTKQK